MSNEKQQITGKAITAREIWMLSIIVYAILICPVAYFSTLSGMAFDGGPPYPDGLYVSVFSCLGTAPVMLISIIVSGLAYFLKFRKVAIGLLLLPVINLVGFILPVFLDFSFLNISTPPTPVTTVTATAEDHLSRGRINSVEGNFNQAVGDFNQAAELDPDNAAIYYSRGFAYRNLELYKRAIDDYTKAIELDPAYTAAYSARGDVYTHYEDYQQAIADYNKAIELNPNGDVYVRRGSVYYASGNREQASLDFSKAVELASTPVIGHNNVAWTLAYDLDTNYEEALEHALRSVELDPQAYNHDTLGLVYYKLKQYEKAVEHYSISLSLDADYTESYKGRGDAYLALGNKQAALADYQTYFAKEPLSSDRTAVEIIIRSLQEK